MGAGAYAVFIDQPAGGGAGGALRRVVPVPPPDGSGDVRFTTVAFSLAYDNFGDHGAPATIPATLRLLKDNKKIETIAVDIEVGREIAMTLASDVQAVSVELKPPGGFRPCVAALVEYTTD